MKASCHFCGERYSDENLYTCHSCHAEYCFRDECSQTHEIRCSDLTRQYETIYESPRGTYSLSVEPREWYDEVREGNPFRCLNCEKTLWLDSIVPMSPIMSLGGAVTLKRLFCSRAHFHENLKSEYPFIRGFCRHCDSLLELRQWQGIVEYTATPPGFRRNLGNKQRFAVVIHVVEGD